MQIHAVSSLDEFLGFPDDPADLGTTVSELWRSGDSAPELCFVADSKGERLGRVGFFTRPTLPPGVAVDLGELPEREAWVFGLVLPSRGDWERVGTHLLAHALEHCPDLPDDAQLRINPTVHSHPSRRRRVAEAAGFELFQEKEGVLWERDEIVTTGRDRLRFRTMAEIGSDAVAGLVSRVGVGTLDRNDHYYFSRMAPLDWGRVFVSLFESPTTTLVGFRDDEPVGFVAVSPFDEPQTATITFIGVLPEMRGSRYVDDLLLAATKLAADTGFERILSDVDVENRPMLAAMERCGHRARATAWHVWHYRGSRHSGSV